MSSSSSSAPVQVNLRMIHACTPLSPSVSLQGNKSYASWLIAPQRGIIRLDKSRTPKDIDGLCTDGLITCVGMVMRSTDGERISLLHTDAQVHIDAIIGECNWIRDGTLHIVKGIMYAGTESSPRAWAQLMMNRDMTLGAQIARAMQACPNIRLHVESHPAWSVTVDREGTLRLYAAPSPTSNPDDSFVAKRRSNPSLPDIPRAVPLVVHRTALALVNVYSR